MITSYKQKANIAGAIFMVALVGPIVLVNVLAWTGHKVLRDMGDTSVLANAIMIALVVPYKFPALNPVSALHTLFDGSVYAGPPALTRMGVNPAEGGVSVTVAVPDLEMSALLLAVTTMF